MKMFIIGLIVAFAFANSAQAIDMAPAAHLDTLSAEEKNGFLEMLAGYYAKEICSCYFVSGLDLKTCYKLNKQSPNLVSVHRRGSELKATALLFWHRKAIYKGPEQGCTLQ